MDLIELLNDDCVELPLVGKPDLEGLLSDTFDKYREKLGELTGTDSATQMVSQKTTEISQLADCVTRALDAWLNGLPEKAVAKLDEGLRTVATEVNALSWVPVDASSHGPLFRIRTAELNTRFQRKDLFHIPFEKRDRVATQRYSFPGLPCLYFGHSLYVCWEECGRPELASIWASKFRVSEGQNVRVLDFGFRPATMAAMLQDGNDQGEHQNQAAAYATLWPLIAACSIQKQSGSSRQFVVEYVIPQLLLRWVIQRQREHQEPDGLQAFDGIRYFSTHVSDYNVDVAGMNYVFPVQARAVSGFCGTLSSKFKMTAPINWQVATSSVRTPQIPDYNNVTFQISPEWSERYHWTVFSRVEGLLDGLPMSPVE